MESLGEALVDKSMCPLRCEILAGSEHQKREGLHPLSSRLSRGVELGKAVVPHVNRRRDVMAIEPVVNLLPGPALVGNVFAE
jgi:hypothetical protein